MLTKLKAFSFIKKISFIFDNPKSLILNILAFVSISIAFIYTIILGRIFGITKDLDIYFATYSLMMYVSYLAQIFYECFITYYADLKLSAKNKADELYSTLLSQTTIFALILVLILNTLIPVISKYFIFSYNYDLLIKLLSFFVILQNIYLINKHKLNINFKFTISYSCEITLYILNILFILIFYKKLGINSVALSINLSYFTVILVQFLFIFKNLKTNFSFILWHNNTKDIIKGSFFMKAGSLLYGFKDIFINNTLLGAGVGVNSTYQYAMKFATAVHSVINAPNITMFSSEINYMVSKKNHSKVPKKIRNLSIKLISMFTISAVLTYLLIPYIIKYSISNDIEFITNVRYSFALLCVFYLIVIIDSPFLMTLIAFKKFGLILLINFIFFTVFILGIFTFDSTITTIILTLIVSQFINYLLYRYFANKNLLSY